MSENARAYGGPRPPHGSIAEEAAKLVEVAQLWLASQSRPAAPTTCGPTRRPRTPTSRPSAGAAPSAGCARVLSDVSPEVYEHLAEAVAAVGAAIRALDTGRRPDGRP